MNPKPSNTVSYHHFSLTFDKQEIKHRFSNVRFVLVAGSALRAEAQAKYLTGSVDLKLGPLELLTKPFSRFTLFKVGPVLVANHGMGPASMSIAVHELMLMCQVADVISKITLVRLGTCGGIGVQPGTICITRRALDPLLQDFIELKICMRVVRRQCVVDLDTATLLEQLGQRLAVEQGKFEVRGGATVGTNDFYEEQGRITGSICEHTQEDKERFLETLCKAGVINMEMEANYLAAMCHKLNVSFGIICVALNNRLMSDRVELSHDDIMEFEQRLFQLNARLIKHKLNLS